MLSKLFLGVSLLGAEWVLYFLLLISILSIALIFERVHFYRTAARGLDEFRKLVRAATSHGKIEDAVQVAQSRTQVQAKSAPDLEAEMAFALLSHPKCNSEILGEIAQDAVVRARLAWDRNLSVLATIGSNAPFVGLFGTVLGIIKAFHDLSLQTIPGAIPGASSGAQTVTSGISEALVATAVGLLVAIPAVVAFNLFQRRVKSALAEAEALKSFLIGKLANKDSK